MDPIEDLISANQIIENATRTIVCNPEAESRLKTRLQLEGVAGLYDVQPNPYCPIDRAYIIDRNGLDAALNEALQHGKPI